LIRSTTGCQAALGDGNGLTDRSRESPLLPRSNELHEQSEDEKAMNTAMKNQIDCSIEFGTEADWKAVTVRIKQILSSMGVVMPELEDLAQEVCIKIIGRRVRVRYRSWLKVVARNVVVDFYRRQYRRVEGISRESEFISSDQASSASKEETDCRLSSVPNPVRDVLEFDFKEAILREFAGLEAHQKQTMYLYVEGVPYDQIAALTGVSGGTVRSRIHYGKRKLRERLAAFR
jgi:RNA polymerase sigma factor (sigma-70 family)